MVEINREILWKFWMIEKQGVGLKKKQFTCDLKESHINKILKEARKDKKIFYGQRRWFLSPEFYESLKLEMGL